VLPWLAAERPQVFNAYQREQNPDAEKALMKAEIAASFIAQDDERALFVGVYRRKGWHPITNEQYWAIPENAEMKPFGLGGIKDRETALWFDLEPMDTYKEWKGRLVVKWPPGRLWCFIRAGSLCDLPSDRVLGAAATLQIAASAGV
jgi:hypothetical protein